MKIKTVIKQFKNTSQTLGCRLWCALCQPHSIATIRLLFAGEFNRLMGFGLGGRHRYFSRH